MKRFLAFLSCVSLLLLAACHEDPYLTVSPTNLSFGQDGGSQTIQVSANYAWTASVSGSGFKISPSSGEGIGSVTVTASAATSPDEVIGSVSFQSEGLSANVALKQEAKTVIQVGSVSKIPAEGGTVTVDVQYNTEFTVEVESDAQSWISFVQTKALKSGKLEFSFKANETYEGRSGKAVVKDKSGKVSPITLTFEQEAKKWVDVTGITLSAESAEVEVGETLTLKATVIPDDASDKTVTWSSDKSSVAKVDGNGKVTGVSRGIATITAKAGGKSAACKVTVKSSSYELERAALEAFYKANGGDKWKYKDNWCTDRPFNTWYGVETNASGHVTGLNFWSNNLRGYIPKEIANLTELERLNLSENEPATSGYKPIPDEIGQLKHLRQLYLQGYALSGKLPASLFDLESLEELYFNNPMFMDPQPIPTDIKKLKNLRVLGMNSMKLTGSMIPELGSLFNLEWLRLNDNNLTGGIPESLGNLKNLDFFEAWGNQLSGVFPTAVGMLDNYWKLWPGVLRDNLFTMDDLAASKIPSPRSPKVKTLSGKTLDLEAEFRKNKYTVLFSVAPEFSYSMAVEDLTSLERFYQQTKDKGLGIITYLDNQAEAADEKTWDDHFKSALKESGAEWESFIRYQLHTYPEGESPFYSTPYMETYPYSGANALVIIGPENTVVYSTILDKSGYGKRMENAIAYLEKQFDSPIQRYTSTDYKADGKVTTLQKATTGAGIDLVVTGDAFSDRLIADGTFEKTARNAVENIFAVEPYKSLRERFNIYIVNAVSKNEEYFNGGSTIFSGDFGGGSAVGGDNAKVLQYAGKAVASGRMDNVAVLVLMNSGKTGGTCYMNDPEDKNVYAGGSSVVWVPYNDPKAVTGKSAQANRIVHEMGGHGLGKLADEYYYVQNGTVPKAVISDVQEKQKWGWYVNVDFTGDPAKVLWSRFIGDSNFASEKIGTYEGGYSFFAGVWRPTEQSVMFSDYDHHTFNAPSRAQIYTRIMKLSEGQSWTFSYDDFVKWDKAHRDAQAAPQRVDVPDADESVHVPPVVVGKTWRQVVATP